MPEKELTIVPHNNGPYEVRARVRIVTEAGRVIPTDGTEAWLCRCGHSANKPFCDGSHARVGFQSNLDAPAEPAGEGFEDVCADADVPEGELRGAQLGGDQIVIGRVAGLLYAIGGVCTHQKAMLAEGELDGMIVRCPLHDSGFDLDTGKAVNPPATVAVPTYEVKVEDGRVMVARKPR